MLLSLLFFFNYRLKGHLVLLVVIIAFRSLSFARGVEVYQVFSLGVDLHLEIFILSLFHVLVAIQIKNILIKK